VVSFKPGALDARKLAATLYQRDRLAGAIRGGEDRAGLRFSPHLYNSMEEVDRVVAAVGRYMKTGL
jgi:selenocysteine lyase/cysteine desulfurase